MPRAARPLEIRFWEKVDVKSKDECWPWLGTFVGNYGVLGLGGRGSGQDGAHRIALQIKLGRRLHPGEWSLHSCDNPGCANPNHTFLGNAKRNTADMMKKGRNNCGRVLTAEAIPGIRRRYKAGALLKTLADEFQVDIVTIFHVVKGRTWKHAGGPICSTDMRKTRSGGHPRK